MFLLIFWSDDWVYDEGPYDYVGATEACNARGMVVVQIDNAEENTRVGELLPQDSNSWAWIRNPSLAGSNEYSNFLPDRGLVDNACTRFFSYWRTYHDYWDDQSCQDQGPVVCEKLLQNEPIQGI